MFSGCSISNIINYQKASYLFQEGDFSSALDLFSSTEGYKDSADMVSECTYQMGIAAYDTADYLFALEYFHLIPNYKDSAEKISICKYTLGVDALNAQDWNTAISYLDSLNYEDSDTLLQTCIREKGMHENADYAFWADILRSVKTRDELADKDESLSLLVETELTILQKYESETFYDSRLQELATAYIHGLNTQKASLELKYAAHQIEWKTGLVERYGVLKDLHNEYQLFENEEKYIAIYISNYEEQKYDLEAMKEIDADIMAQLDGITFQHNYQNKMTAPYTNNTPYNFSFNIYFTFYDYSDVRIDESSRSFPDIISGDVNTLSFWCPTSWYRCDFFWEIYDINTYNG